MLALRWLLIAAGVAMFGTAAGVVAFDVYLAMQFQKLMGSGQLVAFETARTPMLPALNGALVFAGMKRK
jgi:hypothetical protein